MTRLFVLFGMLGVLYLVGACDCVGLVAKEPQEPPQDGVSIQTDNHTSDSQNDAAPLELPPFPDSNPDFIQGRSCQELAKAWPAYLKARQRCSNNINVSECALITEHACGCEQNVTNTSGVTVNGKYYKEVHSYFYKLYHCKIEFEPCRYKQPPIDFQPKCVNGYCVVKYRKYCRGVP
jgi:hypothetical protein